MSGGVAFLPLLSSCSADVSLIPLLEPPRRLSFDLSAGEERGSSTARVPLWLGEVWVQEDTRSILYPKFPIR